MAPRISSFMIGLVILIMVVVGVSLFLSKGNENYTSDFTDGDLDKYNKLSKIQNVTDTTREQISDLKESDSKLDIIGGFFTSTYSAFKTTLVTIDTANEIKDAAMEDASVGDDDMTQLVNTGVTIILIVVIFVGIAMALIFKVRT